MKTRVPGAVGEQRGRGVSGRVQWELAPGPSPLQVGVERARVGGRELQLAERVAALEVMGPLSAPQ